MTNEEIIKQQEEFFPQNGGALKDKEDKRDYQAEDLLIGVDVAIPSFFEGYSAIKNNWPDMPYKNQENQFSCVGQAWSLYKQILQARDTGERTELSAKSIYNPIAKPGIGSYIRDGGMRTVNYGVNKETSVPSWGTEAQVTAPFTFTDQLTKEAHYFKNRVVASVSTQDFGTIARMIFLNDGVVSGWNSHCVYFSEYGYRDSRRYLKTPNSYGTGRDLYFFEGQGDLYSIWTAVDVTNLKMTNKIQLVRATGETPIWFLLNGHRYWVFNPQMMADGVVEQIWDGFAGVKEISKEELYSYPKGTVPLSELWKVYISK